ncbi:MAG TPA: lactate utilization protein [Thermomicrobiales bacterium]|nr:lactate utilization protein [Thermomicrobiales bacterium]
MGNDIAQNNLFSTFSANLAATAGIAHRADSLDDAIATIRGIAAGANPIWTSSRLVEAQPALVNALREAGYDIRIPADPAEVRDQPVGMTLARIGIAETGSLLLNEPELADRSVSLMTNLLIAICPIAALKPSLDDAAPILREIATPGPSYATFVTGPSRTADIERQLTIGVQGPAALHVVFLPPANPL